jgi:hypothetical protein
MKCTNLAIKVTLHMKSRNLTKGWVVTDSPTGYRPDDEQLSLECDSVIAKKKSKMERVRRIALADVIVAIVVEQEIKSTDEVLENEARLLARNLRKRGRFYCELFK